MLSKKTKVSLLILLVGAIIFLGYMLWVINQRLPIINQVQDVQFESVLNKNFSFQNDKVKVVGFIYTKCPDICPMTMQDLIKLQARLKEEQLFGLNVQIITITLDPEFDTSIVLRNYASNFNIDSAGWFILRESESETRKIANEFQMNYKKNEAGFIAHTTKLYIVDTKNRIRSTHDMNIGGKEVEIEEIMINIKKVIKEQAS
ncbi:SCO family protein [Cytobacillus suaedae]|nr:SCO family protein [Cytobacillus suaedae]